MGANKAVVFLAGFLLATVLVAATANANVVSTINEGATTSRCHCIETLSDLVHQQSATIEQQTATIEQQLATINTLHLAVQQQGTTIQALQSSVQVLQTSVQTLLTDNRQHSQTLHDVTTRLDAVNTSVTSQVTAVRNRMRSRAVQVAFSAHMTPSSNGVVVGDNSPIVFSMVVTNLGGAYNRHTGVFTAARAGLYVFHFAVINDGAADTIHVALVKNGQTLLVSTAEGIGEYNKYDDATALVTIHLDQGDRVYVKREFGGTRLHGGVWCNFSGFLLALDETA